MLGSAAPGPFGGNIRPESHGTSRTGELLLSCFRPCVTRLSVPHADASGVPHALAHHTLPPHGGQRWRAQLCWQHKKHGHLLEQACRSVNPSRWSSTTNGSLGGSLRPSPAHSLACVSIEFKRGATRVQELIPVENIQRLREYLHAHPELRKATGKGA